jgi:hypothetical protein
MAHCEIAEGLMAYYEIAEVLMAYCEIAEGLMPSCSKQRWCFIDYYYVLFFYTS